MWDKLQTLTRHPVIQFLKILCCDPVQLYCIFLMMTVMQYYHSSMNWLYTVISVFLSFVLMRLFDFVNSHKWLGPLAYAGSALAGLLVVREIVQMGEQSYPITFLVWFLTPQSVVDFSLWYTIAIYLLMTYFLLSAVYYFSKVRCRMFMQFIVMMIPLCLYAKEGAKMPALLTILLLSSYFLLIVFCRQIRCTDGVQYVRRMQSGISIAEYVLAFSILAAVFPKPNITANRQFIDNAMGNSTISDRLMSAISMFTSITDGGNASSVSSRILYKAEASGSLRLRTQTYSYYRCDDTWAAEDYYDYPTHDFDDMLLYSPQELLEAIGEAACLDEDFAQLYGLETLDPTDIPVLESAYLRVIPQFQPSYLLPAPTRLVSLTDWAEKNRSSLQNTISLTSADYYRINDAVDMEYYPDTYARSASVSGILQYFSKETYGQLLQDAEQILADRDSDGAELLRQCREEQAAAETFWSDTRSNDWQSEAIDALAKELTEGLTSDYEKACAIEAYFTQQGFVYDLEYSKADGDNAETFLFSSQRGVCYEFATAMVLLCRSAGLPARYVQGYSMSEMSAQGTPYSSYVIRMRDAHAFPEVYISGYGWLSFEPTVAAEESMQGSAENYYVMIWGFGFLGLAGLAALFWYLLPKGKEYLFRRRLARMTVRGAGAAAFRHMRKCLSLPESATVSEFAEASQVFCGQEIADLAAQLDGLLYAPEDAPEIGSTPQLAQAYEKWYADRRAYLKKVKAEKRRKNRRNPDGLA